MNVHVCIYIHKVYNGSCEYLALVACRKDNAFRLHGNSRTHIWMQYRLLIAYILDFVWRVRSKDWMFNHIFLVGGFNHLENMKVNGKDYPIYEMENNPNVWNHQPDIHIQKTLLIGYSSSTLIHDQNHNLHNLNILSWHRIHSDSMWWMS